jgi:hypothetical protein
MKYIVKRESGSMIYTPSFMKIGSGIQKLMGGREGGREGIHRYTNSMEIV